MDKLDMILGEVRVLRAENREDIEKLHRKIDEVKIQTTKTNGRVTRIEEEMPEVRQTVSYVKKCATKQYKIGDFLLNVSVITGVVLAILTIIEKI